VSGEHKSECFVNIAFYEILWSFRISSVSLNDINPISLLSGDTESILVELDTTET